MEEEEEGGGGGEKDWDLDADAEATGGGAAAADLWFEDDVTILGWVNETCENMNVRIRQTSARANRVDDFVKRCLKWN